MGLRELINDRPVASALFALVIAAVAVGLFVRWRAQERLALEPSGTSEGSAYYTVDDGATFYADASHLPSPHEKNGREAYLARVYRCGTDGEPYVAFLVRLDPALTAELAQYRGRRYPGNPAEFRSLIANGTEYRRPGETQWVRESNMAAARAVMTVTCPDGDEARPVVPPGPTTLPALKTAAALVN